MRIFSILVFFFLIFHSEAFDTDVEILIKAKKNIKEGVRNSNDAILIENLSFLKKTALTGNYLYYYYLALTEYHLALLNLQNKDKSKAGKYIDDGIDNLKTSINIKGDFAESFILLSSLTALKISVKPFLGPFLGTKSFKYLEKALELEPKNPRAHLTKGIALLNTPRLFGGDISQGIKELEMAIKFFMEEKDKDSIQPDWGRCGTYHWLSRAYFKYGNKEKAIEIALEGVSNCPDYTGLIKYLKKLKSNKED